MKDFFNGKRILLTGNTGFKGTWMTLLLKKLGAVVYGYALPLEKISFFNQAQVNIDGQIEGDIADARLVNRAIESFKPEIIIHMASHSSLDKSDKIPDFILRTNIMGVVNLLEATRKNECVKAILIVTSDKCYKNMETEEAYTENSILYGVDPYSASKVCQELISECYRRTFFEKGMCVPSIATARASNVVGPGDFNISRLIPYLIDRFTNNEKVYIRNRYSVRPWQYVPDVLWGYLLLTKKLYMEYGTGNANGAYNFGPKEDGIVSVEEIVNILSKCYSNAKCQYSRGEEGHSIKETKILRLDSTKAMENLKWLPAYSLKEALKETAEFYSRYNSGESNKDLCEEYIIRYLEREGKQENEWQKTI